MKTTKHWMIAGMMILTLAVWIEPTVAGDAEPRTVLDPTLEEAARLTGVPLAESRSLDNPDDSWEENASTSKYLQDVKRHQLELTELMAMKVMIGRQLKSMEAVSEEDISSQERAAILLSKIMALQAQSLRYKEALNASLEIANSGFKPLMSEPESWDGRMCNHDNQQCTHIKPITGLFILAHAQRQGSPESEVPGAE